jgi:hypothetical protein
MSCPLQSVTHYLLQISNSQSQTDSVCTPRYGASCKYSRVTGLLLHTNAFLCSETVNFKTLKSFQSIRVFEMIGLDLINGSELVNALQGFEEKNDYIKQNMQTTINHC